MQLYTKGIFTAEEIFQLIKNNIYATFLPEKKKIASGQMPKKLFPSIRLSFGKAFHVKHFIQPHLHVKY